MKTTRKSLVLLTALVAMLFCTSAGASGTWIAGRDLVANEKPDAPKELFATNPTVSEWSYGMRGPGEVASRNLKTFAPQEHFNSFLGKANFDGFQKPGDSGGIVVNAGSTDVVLNHGPGPLKPIPPGKISIGPGSGNQVPVVRWTAPAGGTYTISASWLDLDKYGGNGASAHVVINGTVVFQLEFPNDGGAEMAPQTFNLNAGDLVDFCVGTRGNYSFDSTRFDATITAGSNVPASRLSNTGFTVNDSISPAAGLADSVLRFASAQSSFADGMFVRVQATTTPTVQSSWTDIPQGNAARMTFDVVSNLWVVNSTNYPHQNGIYFRSITAAGGVADNISNVVGPFDLASTRSHLGPTQLRINDREAPSAVAAAVPLSFTATQANGAAIVRIQFSATPHEEVSWTDLDGGRLTKEAAPGMFSGSSNKYPTGEALYFRAISAFSNSIDSLSNVIGPFNLTRDTSPLQLWGAGRDLKANEKPDEAKETSATNATVPQWSYGFRAVAASRDLTLFTAAQHKNTSSGRAPNTNPGIFGMDGWDPDAAVLVNAGARPAVYNYGSGPLRPVLPDQLFMHPSSSNQFAVARWTAPRTASYRLVARWLHLDPNGGNGVSAHVVINGEEKFASNLPRGGLADTYTQTFDLQAGSTVDFLVGSRGDFSSDSTGVNVAVREVPTVSITEPGDGLTVSEGQDVVFRVSVDPSHPVKSVALHDNGKVVERDETEPYEFTVRNIRGGRHHFTAIATDAAGVDGVSQVLQNGTRSEKQGIHVNVLPRAQIVAATVGANPKTSLDQNGGKRTAAAATGPQEAYFFAKSAGEWNDPNSWVRASDGRPGVPGENDLAFIDGPGGAGSSVVTLRGKFQVMHLGVGPGSKIIGDRDIPSFELGILVSGTAFVNGGTLEHMEFAILEGAEFESQGNARFTNVNIFNNGRSTFTGPGTKLADTLTALKNNGHASIQPAPGSNQPPLVVLPTIETSKVFHVGSPLVSANILVNNGGNIVGNASAGIISRDGAGIVAAGAGNLIGADGASLVGPDGASIVAAGAGNIVAAGAGNIAAPDGAAVLAPGGATPREPNSTTAIGGPREGLAATGPPLITIESGGTISGNLDIGGAVLNRGGFVSPGNSEGVIRVRGDYTQQAGGTLLLEVGGAAATAADAFDVIGTANLGGNLIVKTINNYTPQAGDSFAPFTYDTVNGSFANVTSNAQVNFGAEGMTMQVNGPNPPAPKALNIATRMRVETGDNVLIAGFIVTGTQPKKVLVRGIGPSLPVGDALADPTLDLDGGAFFNDDWRTDQQGEIEATSIPPASDLESAIVATLEPGLHTAVLRGKNDGTGVGLVEVYDLESGAPAQLANISTRGQVQTGDNVMIGGFIIAGDYPAKVLLRAIGPSLPVEGALQDPTLELVDGQGNTITNDNWRATQEAEVIATTVPPTNDREAAIVATLVPGAYTAVVRGKDDTIGVALVEGYNLQ